MPCRIIVWKNIKPKICVTARRKLLQLWQVLKRKSPVENYLGSLIFFCLPAYCYFSYYYMLWKTDTNSNQIRAHTTKAQGTCMTYMCQVLISVTKMSLLYRTKVFSILPPIAKGSNHNANILQLALNKSINLSFHFSYSVQVSAIIKILIEKRVMAPWKTVLSMKECFYYILFLYLVQVL